MKRPAYYGIIPQPTGSGTGTYTRDLGFAVLEMRRRSVGDGYAHSYEVRAGLAAGRGRVKAGRLLATAHVTGSGFVTFVPASREGWVEGALRSALP